MTRQSIWIILYGRLRIPIYLLRPPSFIQVSRLSESSLTSWSDPFRCRSLSVPPTNGRKKARRRIPVGCTKTVETYEHLSSETDVERSQSKSQHSSAQNIPLLGPPTVSGPCITTNTPDSNTHLSHLLRTVQHSRHPHNRE